ncbi:pyridoxamine 5'-phosphate oxidase family protein [Actinomadura litoris]|uniref:pyridoxamine 5'-phosphate oxidase family protein n=1 Tax=Actinomadura litoris TaxID=2678616 RepID=UPI001FA76440|nr:pyridoxamine 5'-phosphate oxidase family protein [Actinomadura litoris]
MSASGAAARPEPATEPRPVPARPDPAASARGPALPFAPPGRAAYPAADRPHMPGYGILGADEGSGLLPWAWAVERLRAARNFWLCTVRPDGRPHAMPVWGAWSGEELMFSSSVPSRKMVNLRANPNVVVTTEEAEEPVVIEGTAKVVTELGALQRFIDLVNAKYATGYRVDFLDPVVNATVAVRPQRAFGMRQGDFTGSPTRWSFGT